MAPVVNADGSVTIGPFTIRVERPEEQHEGADPAILITGKRLHSQIVTMSFSADSDSDDVIAVESREES